MPSNEEKIIVGAFGALVAVPFFALVGTSIYKRANPDTSTPAQIRLREEFDQRNLLSAERNRLAGIFLDARGDLKPAVNCTDAPRYIISTCEEIKQELSME